MNIRSRLLTISNNIIPSMDLSFQDFLNENLEVLFLNDYPENKENLIRIETLIPKIEISGHKFNIWSEEFQKLAEKNLPRKYLISLNYTHQLCFNSICNYFEILTIGQFDFEAQKKIDEYFFYLEIQTKHSNPEFTIDYIRYWRELLLRLINEFETKATTFSTLFHVSQHQNILNNLRKAIELTPQRKFN